MSKIKNKWLANMPANTMKGNDTSGTAVPKDLTVAEIVAMLGTTITGSDMYSFPVVETPSTIVRTGDDLGEPELVYELDSDGDLDVVSTLE